MYTEEEAKKKWCPMGKSPVWVDDYGNTLPAPMATNRDSLCLASECMYWRWVEGEQFGFESEKGYCGLAGKP